MIKDNYSCWPKDVIEESKSTGDWCIELGSHQEWIISKLLLLKYEKTPRDCQLKDRDDSKCYNSAREILYALTSMNSEFQNWKC